MQLTSAFRIQHSAFLYLTLFLVLTLAWLWPLPTHPLTRIAPDRGDPVLNSWILWWNTQAFPFTERWWNPPIFFPSKGALALSEHLFGIAVFTTPLHAAGVNPIAAYNIALILSCWLSAFFAFLLGRRLTGSALAGAVAGVAFGFAPYRAGQLSHIQVLAAQWMPLALFSMHSYLDDRRRRWLVLFGIAWFLQATSNGYYLLFFPVLLALWLCWFVRWRIDPRPGLAIVVTFLISSIALAPSLLKYREVHLALGLARGRGEMMLFSADPATFLGVPYLASWLRIPYLLKFWPYHGPKTQEDLLFPGATAVLLLAAAALFAIRRRTWPRLGERSPLLFYAGSSLVMWALALGPAPEDKPYLWLMRPYTFLLGLPGFSGLRVPARFAMLACFALSIGAAVAFWHLRQALARGRMTLTLVVFVGLFVDSWINEVPLYTPPTRFALPTVRDAVIMELPVDVAGVGAAAMFRSIEHGRPVISSYSGHVPPHYRILTSALKRDDPSAILHFAEGRPLIIIVHTRYDADRALENVVRSLPGIQVHAGSSAGSVFVLPPQPRQKTAAFGPALQPAGMREEAREHVVFDLGSPQFVRGVGFPVRWHFEELHPQLEIEASDDGVTWTRAWFGWTGGPAIAGALEDQREVPVRIQLPDVRARYLRIHPAQRWMTRELTIYGSR